MDQNGNTTDAGGSAAGGTGSQSQGSLTDLHTNKLTTNFPRLVEKLQNVCDIVEYLGDRKCLTGDQTQVFLSKPTDNEKHRYLIQTLLRRDEIAYREFVGALAQTQDTPELYQLLRDDSMPEVPAAERGPPNFGLAKKYCEQLKAFHRRNLLRVSTKTGHTHDLKSYVSLTLYSQKSKIRDLRKGYKELSGIDAVRALGPPIKAENLFKIVNPTDEKENPRVVLLVGSPGVGKTATAYHFLHETVEGRLWSSDIHFVFLILLRELNHVTQEMSVKNLLLNSHGPEAISTDKVWEMLMKKQLSVLVILDGYDELDGLGTNEDKNLQYHLTSTTAKANPKRLIYNVIAGNVMGDCKVLVTSRPHCSELLSGCVSRTVELDGLDTDKISVMGSNILEGKRQLLLTVMEYLKNHQNVKNLLRSPINAKGFFGHIQWSQATKAKGMDPVSCLPKTRAALLYLLVLNLLRHHDQALYCKYKEEASENRILKSRNTLIKKMAALAYSALVKKNNVQQLFSADDLAQHNLTVEEVTKSGLMTSHTSSIAENFWSAVEVLLAFLHLTVQEFFAALELCQVSLEDLLSISQNHQGEHDMLLLLTLGAMTDPQCRSLLTSLYPQPPTDVFIPRVPQQATTADISTHSAPKLQSSLVQLLITFFERISSQSPDSTDASAHIAPELSTTADVYTHRARHLLTGVCTSPRRFLSDGDLFCLYALSESGQFDLADLTASTLLNVFNSLNLVNTTVNSGDCDAVVKFLESLSHPCDHVVLGGRLDVSTVSNVVCTGGFRGLSLTSELSEGVLGVIGQATDDNTNFRYLTLADDRALSPDAWRSFKPSSHSNLQGLHLGKLVDDENFQTVCDKLLPILALQSLCLSLSQVSTLSPLVALKQLQYLTLNECQVGPDATHVFSHLIVHNPLLWLHISGFNVGDSGAAQLADSLKHPTSVLSGLLLQGCGVGCEGAKALGRSLHNNTHLAVFDISYNDIGGSEEALAAALASSAIEELYLWHCGISSQGACLLVNSLTHNTKLRELALIRNILSTKEFAMSVKRLLHQNKHLQALELAGCGITTDMLATIRSGLAHNNHIRLFNIGENPDLSSSSITVLLAHSRIQYMCTAGCELGRDGWREVGRALRANKHMIMFRVGDEGREEELDGLLEEMANYPQSGPMQHLMLRTADRARLAVQLSHLRREVSCRVNCSDSIFPMYALSGLWHKPLPPAARTWMSGVYYDVH